MMRLKAANLPVLFATPECGQNRWQTSRPGNQSAGAHPCRPSRAQKPRLTVKAAAPAAAPPEPGIFDNIWTHAAPASSKSYPQITQSGTADVVIVGGGIAGLSTAYQLCKAGKRVVVLEAETIGSGQTGRSTAHLLSWPDSGIAAVEEEYNPRTAALLADAQRYAISTIEQISRDEGIDSAFGYVDGYLFGHNEARETFQLLEAERAAASRAGVKGVELVDLGGQSKVGGIRKALKFPRCATFNPLAYAKGLASAIQRHGGIIHEQSRAQTPDGNTVSCKNTGASVTAENLVLATSSPIHRNLAVHSRQNAVRTYIIGLKVPEGSVESVQLWDTDQPYHYVRLVKQAPHGDVLLVADGGHSTGQNPDDIGDRFAAVEQWARRRFPQAQDVVYRWGGQAYEPIDKIALYGQDPINALQVSGTHYVATGGGRQNATGGVIAGRVISDQILGITNPWTKVFAPGRLPTASVQTAINAVSVLSDVGKGYLRNVIPAETQTKRVQDLAPGTGAVLTLGPGQVAAAYVDLDGTQHVSTAVCPHLECVVQWNPTDETFNCPCHGASFTKTGKVIQGPATSDLASL